MATMVRITLAIVAILLGQASGQTAWGTPLIQDQLSASTAHVVPYYNVAPGHAAHLLLHAGPGGDDVTMFFYDQDCTLRVNFFTELTDFDTFFLDLEDGFKDATGIPFEGAILLIGTGPFYATVVNVDVLGGTASTWPSIPLNTDVGDWLVYNRQVILALGPKDDGLPFSTVVTLSCPQGELGQDMEDLIGGGGLFQTHSGFLDLFVFDIDETFLGSRHNVECRCFERKALRDWTLAAATQDVVIYFQDQANAVSTAGYQETLFVEGALKLFSYTYLNHSPDFFATEPVGGGEPR